MWKSSSEQLEGRCTAALDEKAELESKINSLRTEFDLERKGRQDLESKNLEFESKQNESTLIFIMNLIGVELKHRRGGAYA